MKWVRYIIVVGESCRFDDLGYLFPACACGRHICFMVRVCLTCFHALLVGLSGVGLRYFFTWFAVSRGFVMFI